MTIDIPDNWEAGIGNRSDTHYTKYFYHDNYELRVYWDKNQDHTALLRKVVGKTENGQPKYNEHPETSKTAKSEDKIMEKAQQIMENHQ